MKPHQTAYQVACYMREYRNKPVSVDAITEYFKAGLKRELERVDKNYYQWEVWDDINAWKEELEKWLMCWYQWAYAY